MISFIVRRFTGVNVQKPTGSRRETRIQNFFHARASERRKQNKNTILGIQDKDGNQCGDQDSIAKAAISYFEDIYSTSHPNQLENVIAPIPTLVTSRAFTREEVVFALKQLHPSKSPGPDGMSALFFQKYQSIVGTNVSNMVLNVLNSSTSLSNLNRTNIALVPKTNNPQRMTKFRHLVYVMWFISLSQKFQLIISKLSFRISFPKIKVFSLLIGLSLIMYWWRMKSCTS